NHFLPRVGTRSRCIMEDGEVYIYASSCSYQSDKIEFSETDEQKKNVTCFMLEKIAPNKTKLTLDYYIKKSPGSQLLFAMLKQKKMNASLSKSLSSLDALSKEVRLPA